jgi:hypothetical protein
MQPTLDAEITLTSVRSKYNDKLHQNLWGLVEEAWRYQSPSALRLDVVIPNRVILEKQLEEQKQLEGGKPPYKLDKYGREDYNYDELFGHFDWESDTDMD